MQRTIASLFFNNSLNTSIAPVMKDTTELHVDWNKTKEKLKQKFAMLNDNDVLLTEGKQDEMLGRLQIKLGKTKEELLKIIGALFSTVL